ncbi:hypothetical protein BKA70DRAFT_1436241 [Coprinopsis sp. MPI-PUGE-AT-0042]|nr:hypothetical protein BKA70DRAFT_1436241 [Coprinopsis sp. MPI-PUGE-AT-0042]
MRGSVCGAPALSQTLQKLLERVESLERLTEVLRGDVVKATSLASHYKREMDDLSRRFDDATAKNRVQVQDLQHENQEIQQQLNETTRQLNEFSDARHLELAQQNDCEIASLRRRTDDLASEVTELRSEAREPPPSRPTVSAAAQTDPSGIPDPLPPALPQRNHSPAPRPPPSRSSSVPARPPASWSRPSSPGLGADSPNWRRPLLLLVDGSHRSPPTAIRPHRHRETDFATRSGECPYCHRPWNRRSPCRRRIPNLKAA